MRSGVIPLLAKRGFDFSSITAGAAQTEIAVPEVDVSGFGSAVMIVRVHSNSVTGSSAITVQAYTIAPSEEDPDVTFKAATAAAKVTVDNSGASPAGTLLISGVAEAFGRCLRVEVTGLRAGSDTVSAEISIDLVARTSVPAASRPVAAVVRDIDYTAEASATLGDGAVTLGGVEHTVLNSAAASQFDLVNGTGLVMRYRTTGVGVSFAGSTQTAPAIYSTLGNLIPSHSSAHRYLLMWHYSVPATWHTSDVLQFLFYAGSSTTNWTGTFYEGVLNGGVFTRGAGRAQQTNASVQPGWVILDGTTVGPSRSEICGFFFVGSTDRNAYNVIGMRHLPSDNFEVYAGIYDGGWPELESLQLVGHTERAELTTGSFGDTNLPITRAVVALSGPTGSADPHGVDLHRLRVVDLGI